ncbi:hypothetical protein GCM10011386_27000 [Parapedobacter defluvii]|uniref:Conjugative transposon TraM C-terminal domain-containing protein n=2 Tax=Parapedobacter defluvii TaxID=2045106 RepID=A0ABQ1M1N9_9SPHI|nr:hypothetical protein GCM10011386_27000 [Parapedobacter defluvii]
MRQKRKFLLALPLLVLPFAALAFYALGGGQGTQSTLPETTGINTGLPEASFKKERPANKLDYYEQARRDSLQRARSETGRDFTGTGDGFMQPDPQEQRITEKLALLEQELSRPEEAEPVYGGGGTYRMPVQAEPMPDTRADIERLERMMERLNASEPADDPEMGQLNAMLETILDIQHPGRVQEKLREQSLTNRESVYPVTLAGDSLPDNAIRAAIHRDGEVINGSSIQLRLLDSVYINGRLIPANSFAYGICAIGGERLTISVRTVRHGNSILPVSLTAYDMDGIEGLKASGSLTRDAVGRGSNDAIQSMQLMSLDPSLAAQAATVGVNAAKGLFSRRVRQAKVNTKAGYDLLLRDDNQR